MLKVQLLLVVKVVFDCKVMLTIFSCHCYVAHLYQNGYPRCINLVRVTVVN